MISNLQNLMGANEGNDGEGNGHQRKGSSSGAGDRDRVPGAVQPGVLKPSLQPNEYMDGIINHMKTAMRDRGLHEMALPDQEVGVSLYNGQVTGLTNLSRRGDALLEAERDYFLLSFALQAKDVRCAYWWRKRRLKLVHS